MSRIRWDKITKDIYEAYNKDEELLGSLQYEPVGRHHHWCWYQMDEIRMSPGCLQEVRDMQRRLWAMRIMYKND